MGAIIPPTVYDPQVGVVKEDHDLDRFLSIADIRSHTKTDDVSTVSDIMLKLYRRAALEAAQKYTGILLMQKHTVTMQLPEPPRRSAEWQTGTYRVKVSNPFAHPVAFVYGHKNMAPRQISVEVGSSVATVPILLDDFGLNRCCDPCAAAASAGKMQYTSGFDCLSNVPAAVMLGALKYIAHVVENPGDIVTTANEAQGVTPGRVGLNSANNPSVASGAIEIWRTVNDRAI